jgi:hypothetical protein
MTIGTRIKATIGAAKVTSRPVWTFLIVEAVTGVAVVVALALAARHLAGVLALDELPPWRTLAVLPAAGAAAHTLRAAGPVEALRRWHGVATRRIDERWAAER